MKTPRPRVLHTYWWGASCAYSFLHWRSFPGVCRASHRACPAERAQGEGGGLVRAVPPFLFPVSGFLYLQATGCIFSAYHLFRCKISCLLLNSLAAA